MVCGNFDILFEVIEFPAKKIGKHLRFLLLAHMLALSIALHPQFKVEPCANAHG
jgi:hypothetical protein